MSDAALRLAYAGLHPDRAADLIERFGGIERLVAAAGRGGGGMSAGARDAVRVPAAQRRAALAANRISFVVPGDTAYPAHLAALPDAPPGLFVVGDLPGSPGVAVVGTRRCTRYGLRLAEAYGRAIAAAGWTLVSGLARGIDGAAHRGTVAAGGLGVGVLGCGVDVAYPKVNQGLARRLLAGGGALVSEYPPGSPPLAWRFPPRNRIISGLSRAVVVVEAGVRGGALITARKALDQGIAVFAVPGDVERDTSRGCNLLIRDGAHPVLDPEDLIEELALLLGPPHGGMSGSSPAGGDPILELIALSGEMALDVLAERLDRSVGSLLADVVRLEAAGRVGFDGATVFARGR